MSGIDHSNTLLGLAQADLRALAGMNDSVVFSDAIFGFHAQQAIEKGLKAWLVYLGVTYPKTHDLRLLLGLLEDHGQDVEGLWDMLEFNPYAVQFRYDWALEEMPWDRQVVVNRITILLNSIEQLLKTEP